VEIQTMTENRDRGALPRRRMLIGIVAGLIVALLLVLTFADRVARPAAEQRPRQAPLPTQR